MLEVGGGVDLGQEAFCPEGGGEVWPEDLERHQTVVAEILGEIDRRHTTFTELALDDIAAREGGVQTRHHIHGVIPIAAASEREVSSSAILVSPVSVSETSQQGGNADRRQTRRL